VEGLVVGGGQSFPVCDEWQRINLATRPLALSSDDVLHCHNENPLRHPSSFAGRYLHLGEID